MNMHELKTKISQMDWIGYEDEQVFCRRHNLIKASLSVPARSLSYFMCPFCTCVSLREPLLKFSPVAASFTSSTPSPEGKFWSRGRRTALVLIDCHLGWHKLWWPKIQECHQHLHFLPMFLLARVLKTSGRVVIDLQFACQTTRC